MSNYGYQGPGYRDPLSTGRGFGLPTFSTPTSMSGTPGGGGRVRNVGDALTRILGGAGRGVGSSLDWLTDKDRGENRINAIFGLGSLAASGVGAWQQGRREDRERKRREEEEDRERERQEAADPFRRKIIEDLMRKRGL